MYNEAMAVLYAALNIAWDSQSEHESEFIAENTLYPAGLSVTKKAAIAAAQAMPDGQARGAEAEILRIRMTEKMDVIIGKWNSLDGYISKAFKGEYYKPRIEEAGKQYYEKAANKNWEYLTQLLVSGKNFVTAHSAVLIADGGMPAGFAASFDTVKTEFEGLYSQFKDAQQDSQEQTDAKISANNAIYKEGREMMEDGKRIFRKNASVRDRFIWERIVELVTPPTADGVAVRSGDLNAGEIFTIEVESIKGTEESRVQIEVTEPMQFSAVDNPANFPGPLMLDTFPGVIYDEDAQTFINAVGIKDDYKFLRVQNNGAGTGHYKLKVTHVK